MKQFLFQSLVNVFHVCLHIYQGGPTSDMLRLPRWVVYECLELLGMGKETVEAFAFWGVSDTLHDGGMEVGFREEGVTNQILILLWREERVLSDDMGVLRTDALGGVGEVNVWGGVSGIRRRVTCATTASTDCSGGHCIMTSTK